MGILIRRRGIIAAQPHRATASGALVHVDRAEPAPLSCVVGIDAVQSGSGTPSPSNVRPITGWTGAGISVNGVNLLSRQAEQEGYIDAEGYVGPNVNSRYVLGIPAKPNTEYTLSGIGNYSGGANKRVHAYDAAGTWIQQVCVVAVPGGTGQRYTVTGTTPANTCYLGVSYLYTDTDVQLEYGSTAIAYTPYSGSTVSVTFPAEAGTVYGGTLDTGTGVLTVTHGIIDLSTLDWSMRNNTTSRQAWQSASAIPIKATDGRINAISPQFAPKSLSDSWGPYIVSYAGPTSPLIQTPVVTFASSAYSTNDQVKAALAGIPLVYLLETPITYQLTPTQLRTLRGVNNIFADCGSIAATYWTH